MRVGQHSDDVFSSSAAILHTRPVRERPAGRRAAHGAASLLVGLGCVGAACSPADDEAQASCSEIVGRAAAAIEPADELRLLDQGLVTCGSYDVFATQLQQYPGALGYSVETFIDRRCGGAADEDIRTSPTCLTANPPTTPPTTSVVELVFVGTTVDGRLIEMRPTPQMPFIDDVPAEIQRTVDIALADGCAGLQAQRDRWVAEVNGSAESDTASVFAQHAQNVAAFTGCDIGTLQVTFATESSTVPSTGPSTPAITVP